MYAINWYNCRFFLHDFLWGWGAMMLGIEPRAFHRQMLHHCATFPWLLTLIFYFLSWFFRVRKQTIQICHPTRELWAQAQLSLWYKDISRKVNEGNLIGTRVLSVRLKILRCVYKLCLLWGFMSCNLPWLPVNEAKSCYLRIELQHTSGLMVINRKCH